jgi:hypothetical protein
MLPKVQCEFQIAKPNRLIRQVIDYCTLFWWFAAKATAPLMAALPSDRLFQPAFACTGIDYFSPIEVKIFQRVVKRRGCLFTRLTCSVHSEMVFAIDADTFISVFFISMLRGTPISMCILTTGQYCFHVLVIVRRTGN